jgi:hypothetical protein
MAEVVCVAMVETARCEKVKTVSCVVDIFQPPGGGIRGIVPRSR